MILAVTCAIRDNAERKIWTRLDYYRSLKKKRARSKPPLRVGLLGEYCITVCCTVNEETFNIQVPTPLKPVHTTL